MEKIAWLLGRRLGTCAAVANTLLKRRIKKVQTDARTTQVDTRLQVYKRKTHRA